MKGRSPIVRGGLIITVLTAGVLTACTSERSVAPSPTSTTATTPPVAEVNGELRVAGGPAPGINKPIAGRIEAHRDTAGGEIVGTAEPGDDGTFRMTLPPGSYVFVGSSPRVVLGRVGTPCGGASVTVHGGDNPPVTVYCLIR